MGAGPPSWRGACDTSGTLFSHQSMMHLSEFNRYKINLFVTDCDERELYSVITDAPDEGRDRLILLRAVQRLVCYNVSSIKEEARGLVQYYTSR